MLDENDCSRSGTGNATFWYWHCFCNSMLMSLCSCVCCFVRFLIIKHTYSHGGSTLAFHSGSVPPHTPTQSGWNLIIPYRRSRHSKPTTVSSRSNQELVLKRLWNGALHSPRGEVCCIRRQIFTRWAKVWAGLLSSIRGRFLSTSSQLPAIREASVTFLLV